MERSGPPARASSRFVTPGFFASLKIPIVRGRDVSDQDETDQPYVAVVSESFVKRVWPNDDPIGKHQYRQLVAEFQAKLTSAAALVASARQPPRARS